MTDNVDDVIDTPVDDNATTEQDLSADETTATEPGAADGEQPEDGTDKEAKPDEEKQHKGRAAKRIAELNYQRKVAEQRVAELQAKYESPSAEPSDKPRMEHFESIAEYEDAKDNWLLEQGEKRALAKLQGQQGSQGNQGNQGNQGQHEQVVEMQTSAAELRAQYNDFDAVLKAGAARYETLPLPIELDKLGLSSKELLGVAYTLSKDEDLYYEMASMSQQQAMMRLGQVLLTNSSKTQTPATSKAPKPISPVSANAPAKRDASKMSDDDFLRSRGLA